MTLTLARQASNALAVASHEAVPIRELEGLLTGARQHEALVASASALRVDEASAIDVRRRHRAWQERAWDVVDLVGELWYVQDRKADAYSNLNLFPAVKKGPGVDPVPIDDQDDTSPQAMLLDSLAVSLDIAGGTVDGHAALMRSLAWQLETPGECSMLGTTTPEGENRWTILSLDELRPGGGGWYIYRYPGAVPEQVPKDAFLRRLWKPHPRWSALATSPILASLPILEELIALSDGGMASARSRLANAGAWAIPNELDLRKPKGDGEWSEFDEQIIEAGSTAIREPRSASRFIPFIMRGPGDWLDKIKFFSLFQDVSKEHRARIEALVARLERSLNVPVGTISGTKDANHWCVDEETEALTPSGWVPAHTLQTGQTIRTLDVETGLARWSEVLDTYRADVIDEPMVNIEGKPHSSVTTLEHRWPVRRGRYPTADGLTRRWTVTGRLHTDDHITTGAPASDLPEVPKYPDALVELVGWFWTEGSISVAEGVSIAQSHTVNGRRVARIRAALTALFGPARESLVATRTVASQVTGSRGPAWREHVQANRTSFGGPVTIFYLNKDASAVLLALAPRKVVSPAFVTTLTVGQLALFIEVSLEGDGWHLSQGKKDIFARDLPMLAGLEMAGILAGYTTTIRQVAKGWALNLSEKATLRPVKAAQASSASGSQTGMKITPLHYTGTISCPVTAEGTWLARRRGTVYYTGNSAWFFSEEQWRHLKPGAVTIVASLTVGWYRDALRAWVDRYPRDAARIGDIDRQCIWFDASRLLVKPDRTVSATEGLKSLQVNGEAWRREHGFAEEDAPTIQQQARQFGVLWGDPGLASVSDTEPEPWTKATGKIATRITEAETGPVGVGPVAAEDVGPGPPTPGPPKSGPPGPAPKLPASPGPPASGPVAPSAPSGGPPSPIAAAALIGPESRRQTRTLGRLGTALGRIDHRTFVRLVTAADKDLKRVAEKAGGQIRSKVTSTLGLRGVTNIDLTRYLGPGRASTLGLKEDLLIGNSSSAYGADAKAILAKAQSDALAQVARDLELDPEALDEETAPDRSRALSVVEGILAAGFAATAADYLWRAQEATGPGEIPDMSAPRGAIRDALAVAGGGSPGDKAAIGTGPMVGEALSQGDVAQSGFTWIYTWESRTTFPGHLALDGVSFADWQDDILIPQPEDSWLGDWMFPGDHAGCSCQAEGELMAAGGETMPE